MNKTLKLSIALCAVILLLSSAFFSVGFVKGEAADNRIFIQPDGTVSPTGAPLLIEGDTYTLTENIYTSIVIEKSGITLNGAGHFLQGTFNGTMADLWMIAQGSSLVSAANGSQVPWTIGIDVAAGDISNLKIENLQVENFSIGMYIWTPNNTVTKTTVKGNIVGILVAGNQNNFTENYIEDNTDGIFVGVGTPTVPYSNITVDENYFVDNSNQLNGCHCPASLTEKNPWGINVDGNYWSDYNGTAKKGTDVGETPYYVNGTIPDNNPLTQLPSVQANRTPINLTIEVLLAATLTIVFAVSFIVIKKKKTKSTEH